MMVAVSLAWLALLLIVPGTILYVGLALRLRLGNLDGPTSLSMGFTLSTAAGALGYTLVSGRPLAVLCAVLVAEAVVMVLLGWRLLHTAGYAWRPRWRTALAPLLLTAAAVAGPLLHGQLPILFSDGWGHVTFMNCMLEDRTTAVHEPFFPGEDCGTTFLPWQGLLAAIALLSGGSALMIWQAACLVMPPLLVLSFLSFVRELLPDEVRSPARLVIYGLAFLFLWPGVTQFYLGLSDYRIANQVILFQVLRLFWRCWNGPTLWRTDTMLMFLGLLAMGLIHPVELVFAFLLIVPYALLSAASRRRSPRYWLFIVLLATLIPAIAGLSSRLLFSTTGLACLDYFTYNVFLVNVRYWFEQHLGAPGLLAVVLIPWVLLHFRGEVRWWLAGAYLSALLLGSANPLCYPIYRAAMGSNLCWRTMLLIPSFLIVPAALLAAVDGCHCDGYRRRILSLVLGLAAVVAVGHFLRVKFGLDGSTTFTVSDRISQLRLYPTLYRFLSTKRRQMVLSDPFTAVPVSASGRNFVLAHRGWQNRAERQIAAATALSNLASAEAAQILRQYRVDLILFNPVRPPAIESCPAWFHDDFYRHPVPEPPPEYLQRAGTFDGVVVYRVLRQRLPTKGSTP